MQNTGPTDEEFINLFFSCNGDIDLLRKVLRKDYPTYDSRKQRVEKRINRYKIKGLIPLDSGNSVGTGEVLKGTSTLYDEDGNIKLQWIKTDVAKENALLAFTEAVDNIVERLPVATPKLLPPSHKTMHDLLSIYTIGDAHIGMLSWSKETGVTSNTEKAVQDLTNAMSMLVSQSNPTEEAFIIDVGDYFHSDNSSNKTNKSGNPLDVDGRYGDILEIGLDLTITLIENALQKHNIVRWRSVVGNHNEHSALMLNKFVKTYYKDEPRVIVHDSPANFEYFLFGKNLIGMTHGHTAKPDKLGEIMSVDCEDIWSQSKYRYWYSGHVHHQSVKEYPSCVVETFRTLAGKDAWHHASGYRSGQDMRCIALHKEFGEISRNIVNIHQLPEYEATP